MLTLKTGLPRNGKTVSTVDEIDKLLKSMEKDPTKVRPIFQFGITDLVLEGVHAIDAWPLDGKKGDAIPLRPDGKPASALAFDDQAIPDGALIVIDECQDFFPPRGPSQKPPAHVASLNTHGHRNLDYILLTQHPKLIDNAVRRLVNKHQHYRRMMGGGRAICYEWDVCSDSLEYQKAVKSMYTYPKRVFGMYRSASGFTPPKFRIPAWVIVPLLAIPIGVVAVPMAMKSMYGAMSGKGVGAVASAASAASSPAKTASIEAAATTAKAPEGPASSPATEVKGCIAMGARCQCIDGGGKLVPVPDTVCRENTVRLGGLIPYDTKPGPAGARVPAALEQSSGRELPGMSGFDAGRYEGSQPTVHKAVAKSKTAA